MKNTSRLLSILILFLLFIYGGTSAVGSQDETQSGKYSEAEKNSITTPEGVTGYCYDLFKNEENMKEVCKTFYEREKYEYDKCYTKRIDGTETEASLKSIDRLCYRKSHSKAWKSIEWLLEKKKYKDFYSEDEAVISKD